MLDQSIKRLLRRTAVSSLLLPALFLASCSTQSAQDSKDASLAAAGFTVKPANTAKRQAMLRRLPPNRFVTRVRGNNVTYVYADPIGCDCLYVGSQRAYDQYQSNQTQLRVANQQLLAALAYSDDSWDWSEWGPWASGFYGPPRPGYGW